MDSFIANPRGFTGRGVPGSGHRNELQLELSGRSPGNATTFRDRRTGLEAFLNHGFAVRALLLASGRSGVNPVVESLSTIIEISSVIRPTASAAIVAHRRVREEHPHQRKCGSRLCQQRARAARYRQGQIQCSGCKFALRVHQSGSSFPRVLRRHCACSVEMANGSGIDQQFAY